MKLDKSKASNPLKNVTTKLMTVKMSPTEPTINHALGVGSQLNPTISGVGEVGFSYAPAGDRVDSGAPASPGRVSNV